MSRLFENFLSSRWNVYGLQVLAGSLMVMILHQYLTIFQLCIMGLCVYIITFCQRILGVRYGMLFAQKRRDMIDKILLKQKERESEDDSGNA